MKQFMLGLIFVGICVWLFFSYRKVIGRLMHPQHTIDSSETRTRITEKNISAERDMKQQKYSAEEIREQQKRLIESRKRKMRDVRNRY